MVTAFSPLLDADYPQEAFCGREARDSLQHSSFAVELISDVFVVSFNPTPSVLIPFVVGTVHEVVSSLMSANLNAYINNSECITTVPSGF